MLALEMVDRKDQDVAIVSGRSALYTEMCCVDWLVKGCRSQPDQRSSSWRPARRPMRSISLGSSNAT